MEQNKAGTSVFDDIQVIGELSPEETANHLRELGDTTTADEIDKAAEQEAFESFFKFEPKPWQHKAHQYGYIGLRPTASSEPIQLQNAAMIAADESLKEGRISIYLDKLMVNEYPGGGTHSILFNFAARNQTAAESEPVSFSQMYEAQDKQSVAITGYPIFLGLNVGKQGAAFECATVNVTNSDDESLLAFLDSDTFKNGLNLLETVQPVIKPFTAVTMGLVKKLLSSNKNKAVQKFSLGLDFVNAAYGIRLAEGNYIAVQVPTDNTIDWSAWVFNPNVGTIVSKSDASKTLDYNYVIFRVTRYQE